LNRRRLQVSDARPSASLPTYEFEVLTQVPSVGATPPTVLPRCLRWKMQNCSTRSLSGWAMFPVLRPGSRPRFRRGPVSGGTTQGSSGTWGVVAGLADPAWEACSRRPGRVRGEDVRSGDRRDCPALFGV